MKQAEEVVETPASKRPKTAEEPPPLSGLSAKKNWVSNMSPMHKTATEFADRTPVGAAETFF